MARVSLKPALILLIDLGPIFLDTGVFSSLLSSPFISPHPLSLFDYAKRVTIGRPKFQALN